MDRKGNYEEISKRKMWLRPGERQQCSRQRWRQAQLPRGRGIRALRKDWGRSGAVLAPAGDVARELRSCQHKQALASHVTEFAFYLKSFRKTLMVLRGENNQIRFAGKKFDSGCRVECGLQGN